MSDHDAALDGQKGTVAAGRRRAETPTGVQMLWHAARVLDVACGTGIVARIAAEQV